MQRNANLVIVNTISKFLCIVVLVVCKYGTASSQIINSDKLQLNQVIIKLVVQINRLKVYLCRERQNRAVGVSWDLWPAGRDHINPVFLKLPKLIHHQCQLPETKVCLLEVFILSMEIILKAWKYTVTRILFTKNKIPARMTRHADCGYETITHLASMRLPINAKYLIIIGRQF